MCTEQTTGLLSLTANVRPVLVLLTYINWHQQEYNMMRGWGRISLKWCAFTHKLLQASSARSERDIGDHGLPPISQLGSSLEPYNILVWPSIHLYSSTSIIRCSPTSQVLELFNWFRLLTFAYQITNKIYFSKILSCIIFSVQLKITPFVHL